MKKSKLTIAIVFGVISIHSRLNAQTVTVTAAPTLNSIAKFTNASGTTPTIGSSSIFDNGNVGIGTINPTDKLHIEGSSGVGITPLFQLAKAGGYGYTRFSEYYTSMQEYGLKIGNGTTNYFTMNHYNGRVSIGGVNPPTTKLEIGNVSEQNTCRVVGYGSIDHAPAFSLFRTGSIEWTMASQLASFMISANPANYTDASLASAAKFTITDNGNVGIGTTSPSQKLDVAGNVNISFANKMFFNYNSVNTTAQKYIGFSGNGDLGLISTDGTWIRIGSNNGVALWGKPGAEVANSTPDLFINSSGSVGIGTTTVGAKLHVNANGGAYSFGLLVDGNDPNVKAISVNDQVGTNNFLVYANGNVYARAVTVQTGNFPDYVFEKNYNLMSLKELENYISLNKHLPSIPSASEVEKDGLSIGQINTALVEKVEELTLYVIELNKKIEELKK